MKARMVLTGFLALGLALVAGSGPDLAAALEGPTGTETVGLDGPGGAEVALSAQAPHGTHAVAPVPLAAGSDVTTRVGIAGLSRSAEPAQSGQAGVGLEGHVVSVTDVSAGVLRLVCVTLDGTFTVDVDGDTTLRYEDGTLASASALEAGTHVEVEGVIVADARVAATSLVVVRPPETPDPTTVTLRGRVTANLDADADGTGSLLVARASGQARVEVTAGTQIFAADGGAATLSDLASNTAVVVRGQGQADALVEADRIDVVVTPRPSRVSFEGRLHARGSLDAGGELWIVGGASVEVNADLAARTDVEIGDRVRVMAERSGGLLVALEIEGQPGDAETIQLRGTVEAVVAGSLTVDGVEIQLDGQTVVEGDVAVGEFVEITATLDADGQVTAEQITVVVSSEVEVQFEGQIESVGLLGAWVVNGTEVHVSAETVLTGLPPVAGLHAEVTGHLQADGSVEAARINVQTDILGDLSVLEGTLIEVGPVPGTWTVEVTAGLQAGVTLAVHVSHATVIDESGGAAQAGASVQIRGTVRGDGSVDAGVIRVRRGS